MEYPDFYEVMMHYIQVISILFTLPCFIKKFQGVPGLSGQPIADSMSGLKSNKNEHGDPTHDQDDSADEGNQDDAAGDDSHIAAPKDITDSSKKADPGRPIAVGEAFLQGMNGMSYAKEKLAESKVQSKLAETAANEAIFCRFEKIVGPQNERIEKAFAHQTEINSALLDALKEFKKKSQNGFQKFMALLFQIQRAFLKEFIVY